MLQPPLFTGTSKRFPLLRPVTLVIWLGLAVVVGCDRGGEERTRTLFRFIEQDPALVFQPTQIAEREPVLSWKFETEADLAGWTVGTGSPKIRNGELVAAGERVRMATQLGRPAGDIDGFEVRLVNLRKGELRLLWAGPGEVFVRERISSCRPQESVRDQETVCTVNLAAHPLWRGMIDRIGIDPTTVPGDRVAIREITAVRFRFPADQLAAAVSRPWKVDLDSELRNALLAPPGLQIERDLRIPRDGRLVLSYGLDPGVRTPTTFRVSVARGGGDPEEVFSASIDPDGDGARAWHAADIDLSRFAGKGRRLILETVMPEGTQADLIRGFPVWGSPEVVGRQRGEARPNVILVSLDTLRADRLSLHGHSQPTSPNLDRWAAERAVVFTDAVAPSPWTVPSHFTMLTGQDTTTHGLNHSDPAPPSTRMLAEMLRDAGYTTLAVTGGGHLHPSYGFAQGFDRFRFWPSRAASDLELEGGMGHLLDALDGLGDRPFFAFFHTYEIHSPYLPRQPFFDQFGGGRWSGRESEVRTRSVQRQPDDGYRLRKEFVRRGPDGQLGAVDAEGLQMTRTLYDAGIAYTDSILARLFAALAERGLADSTMVIVTSDHGEALGEKGLAAHAYLYDFNLSVPLVVAFPGGRWRGQRVEAQVTLTDLVPTILDVAGISEPAAAMDGSSLVPLLDGRDDGKVREAWAYAASSNYGVALRVNGRIKYIFNNSAWENAHGDEELFHLGGDAAELGDGAPDEREVAPLRRRMQQKLSDAAGLHVELENLEERSISGRFGAARIDPSWVKASLAGSRRIQWERPGTVRFDLPPGERLDLWFETLGPQVLEVSIAVEGGEELNTVIDPAQMGERTEFVLAQDGWVGGDAVGTPFTGTRLVLWRAGDVAAGAELPAETDPALAAQLRALGYVE